MTAKQNAFPAIPREPSMSALLIALVENVEILNGSRGTSLGALTRQDLETAGFVYDPGSDSYLLPDTSDSTAPAATPTQPTGFTATGTFSAVSGFWDPAVYNGHAYTAIYRSTTDDFGTAVQIMTETGRHFATAGDPGQTYYFWIRHVNTDGKEGPINDTAGTQVTLSTTVTDIIQATQDLLSEDDLTPGLNDRLDSFADAISVQSDVDGIYTAFADNQILQGVIDAAQDMKDATLQQYTAASVVTERDTRITEDAALASQITTVAATAGNATAGVVSNAQAIATLEGHAEANFSLTTTIDSGGNTRVTGMKILNQTGQLSKIIFNTDVFTVASSSSGNDPGEQMFTIGPYTNPSTGVTTNKVVMNSAVIGDATIGSAAITELRADKITVAGMPGNPSTIADVIIGNGHIDNAKIGDLISSDNFNIFTQGWGINKDGTAVFHDIYARGDIQASSLTAGSAMVETLNLAGNAVTVPDVDTYVGILSGSGGWSTNVARATVVVGQATSANPAFILLLVSITHGYAGGGAGWKVRLQDVSTGSYLVNRPIWMTALNDFPSFSAVKIATSPGTYHFQLDWAGENANIAVGRAEVIAQAAKR
ncbi:MAG: hypothetical protein AAGI44_02315 [Pseudomonadota bacterium]